MKYVGIIREHHLDGLQTPLTYLSHKLTPEEKNMVLSYLENHGNMFAVTMQVVRSFVTGEVIGAISFSTDGFWIWPSYFAHYVAKSGVPIPKGFIDYLLGGNKQDSKELDCVDNSSAIDFHISHFEKYLQSTN
jgi:hypothetical protein